MIQSNSPHPNPATRLPNSIRIPIRVENSIIARDNAQKSQLSRRDRLPPAHPEQASLAEHLTQKRLSLGTQPRHDRSHAHIGVASHYSKIECVKTTAPTPNESESQAV
jgi:hypothetical protein